MICEIFKLIVEKQSKFIRTAPSRKSREKRNEGTGKSAVPHTER